MIEFFQRLWIFFGLKFYEISKFVWTNVTMIKVFSIIYLICTIVAMGSMILELKFNQTWPTYILRLSSDNSSTKIESVTEDNNISKIELAFLLVVGLPFIGMSIIFSWMLIPMAIFLILFLLWKCCGWLADNWYESGKIMKNRMEQRKFK